MGAKPTAEENAEAWRKHVQQTARRAFGSVQALAMWAEERADYLVGLRDAYGTEEREGERVALHDRLNAIEGRPYRASGIRRGMDVEVRLRGRVSYTGPQAPRGTVRVKVYDPGTGEVVADVFVPYDRVQRPRPPDETAAPAEEVTPTDTDD